jgi:hypothetical protein
MISSLYARVFPKQYRRERIQHGCAEGESETQDRFSEFASHQLAW